MKSFLAGLAVGVLGFVSVASAQTPAANLTGTVKIDGSSTVYPITEAVAEEFKKVAAKVNVTVGISGTGGGFKKFSVGEIDISDASRSIKKEEHDKAVEQKVEYIEIPVAYDGLTVVINKNNTWAKTLKVDDIKKMFTETKDGKKISTWKEVNPAWPDKAIKFFAPGTDSGTFDYFKEVVAGKDGTIRSGMSVSEDDNVLVKGVAGDENAIGFFGFAYFVENKDKVHAVGIDGGKGAILPTHETIENATYAPFSRPLFIYVNKKAVARPEVKAFVEFYLKKAPDLVEEVGYVKLPSELYSRAAANFTALKTGTQFIDEAGKGKHGPLADIYK